MQRRITATDKLYYAEPIPDRLVVELKDGTRYLTLLAPLDNSPRPHTPYRGNYLLTPVAEMHGRFYRPGAVANPRAPMLPSGANAAAILGARGGRARAAGMTAAQRIEAARATVRARWIERPVLAVRHDADGMQMEGWPQVGRARTWTEAIRLVREAGYKVPSRRTPGWTWDLIPREVAETDIDAFGVPAGSGSV